MSASIFGIFRWRIMSPTMLTRLSPSISRTNFLVQKLCKSEYIFNLFNPSHVSYKCLPKTSCVLFCFFCLFVFFSFYREGQPLKLPETKKTLLFTFNGEKLVFTTIGANLAPLNCILLMCYIFTDCFVCVCACSAWHGQHLSQRHGLSPPSHEHGDLQHR